jgi:hypothetical protein
MLQRVSNLRAHIQAALEKGPTKYVIKLALTPGERILLDRVLSLLKPPKDLTNFVIENNNVTSISAVLPGLHGNAGSVALS